MNFLENFARKNLVCSMSAVDGLDGIQKNLEDTQKTLEQVNVNSVQRYIEELTPKLIAFGIQVLIAIVIYVVGSKLIKLVRKIMHRTLTNVGAEQGVMTFLDSLVKISLYAILIISIATRFGLQTTSVVAVLGSAGLALGLALQGSLANFAGGVLLLILKPFRVGDYIIAGGDEGSVKEISIFYTKLATVDNRIIVIPNGNLTNSSLVNVTHQNERMVQIKVGISYEANIQTAKSVLTKVLSADPNRLQDKEMAVYVDELADSAVVIGCRIWVDADAYWAAKWRLTEQIKEALDEAGIEIPYPQVVVNKKEASN